MVWLLCSSLCWIFYPMLSSCSRCQKLPFCTHKQSVLLHLIHSVTALYILSMKARCSLNGQGGTCGVICPAYPEWLRYAVGPAAPFQVQKGLCWDLGRKTAQLTVCSTSCCNVLHYPEHSVKIPVTQGGAPPWQETWSLALQTCRSDGGNLYENYKKHCQQLTVHCRLLVAVEDRKSVV